MLGTGAVNGAYTCLNGFPHSDNTGFPVAGAPRGPAIMYLPVETGLLSSALLHQNGPAKAIDSTGGYSTVVSTVPDLCGVSFAPCAQAVSQAPAAATPLLTRATYAVQPHAARVWRDAIGDTPPPSSEELVSSHLALARHLSRRHNAGLSSLSSGFHSLQIPAKLCPHGSPFESDCAHCLSPLPASSWLWSLLSAGIANDAAVLDDAALVAAVAAADADSSTSLAAGCGDSSAAAAPSTLLPLLPTLPGPAATGVPLNVSLLLPVSVPSTSTPGTASASASTSASASASAHGAVASAAHELSQLTIDPSRHSPTSAAAAGAAAAAAAASAPSIASVLFPLTLPAPVAASLLRGPALPSPAELAEIARLAGALSAATLRGPAIPSACGSLTARAAGAGVKRPLALPTLPTPQTPGPASAAGGRALSPDFVLAFGAAPPSGVAITSPSVVATAESVVTAAVSGAVAADADADSPSAAAADAVSVKRRRSRGSGRRGSGGSTGSRHSSSGSSSSSRGRPRLDRGNSNHSSGGDSTSDSGFLSCADADADAAAGTGVGADELPSVSLAAGCSRPTTTPAPAAGAGTGAGAGGRKTGASGSLGALACCPAVSRGFSRAGPLSAAPSTATSAAASATGSPLHSARRPPAAALTPGRGGSSACACGGSWHALLPPSPGAVTAPAATVAAAAEAQAEALALRARLRMRRDACPAWVSSALALGAAAPVPALVPDLTPSACAAVVDADAAAAAPAGAAPAVAATATATAEIGAPCLFAAVADRAALVAGAARARAVLGGLLRLPSHASASARGAGSGTASATAVPGAAMSDGTPETPAVTVADPAAPASASASASASPASLADAAALYLQALAAGGVGLLQRPPAPSDCTHGGCTSPTQHLQQQLQQTKPFPPAWATLCGPGAVGGVSSPSVHVDGSAATPPSGGGTSSAGGPSASAAGSYVHGVAADLTGLRVDLGAATTLAGSVPSTACSTGSADGAASAVVSLNAGVQRHGTGSSGTYTRLSASGSSRSAGSHGGSGTGGATDLPSPPLPLRASFAPGGGDGSSSARSHRLAVPVSSATGSSAAATSAAATALPTVAATASGRRVGCSSGSSLSAQRLLALPVGAGAAKGVHSGRLSARALRGSAVDRFGVGAAPDNNSCADGDAGDNSSGDYSWPQYAPAHAHAPVPAPTASPMPVSAPASGSGCEFASALARGGGAVHTQSDSALVATALLELSLVFTHLAANTPATGSVPIVVTVPVPPGAVPGRTPPPLSLSLLLDAAAVRRGRLSLAAALGTFACWLAPRDWRAHAALATAVSVFATGVHDSPVAPTAAATPAVVSARAHGPPLSELHALAPFLARDAVAAAVGSAAAAAAAAALDSSQQQQQQPQGASTSTNPTAVASLASVIATGLMAAVLPCTTGYTVVPPAAAPTPAPTARMGDSESRTTASAASPAPDVHLRLTTTTLAPGWLASLTPAHQPGFAAALRGSLLAGTAAEGAPTAAVEPTIGAGADASAAALSAAVVPAVESGACAAAAAVRALCASTAGTQAVTITLPAIATARLVAGSAAVVSATGSPHPRAAAAALAGAPLPVADCIDYYGAAAAARALALPSSSLFARALWLAATHTAALSPTVAAATAAAAAHSSAVCSSVLPQVPSPTVPPALFSGSGPAVGASSWPLTLSSVATAPLPARPCAAAVPLLLSLTAAATMRDSQALASLAASQAPPPPVPGAPALVPLAHAAMTPYPFGALAAATTGLTFAPRQPLLYCQAAHLLQHLPVVTTAAGAVATAGPDAEVSVAASGFTVASARVAMRSALISAVSVRADCDWPLAELVRFVATGSGGPTNVAVAAAATVAAASASASAPASGAGGRGAAVFEGATPALLASLTDSSSSLVKAVVLGEHALYHAARAPMDRAVAFAVRARALGGCTAAARAALYALEPRVLAWRGLSSNSQPQLPQQSAPALTPAPGDCLCDARRHRSLCPAVGPTPTGAAGVGRLSSLRQRLCIVYTDLGTITKSGAAEGLAGVTSAQLGHVVGAIKPSHIATSAAAQTHPSLPPLPQLPAPGVPMDAGAGAAGSAAGAHGLLWAKTVEPVTLGQLAVGLCTISALAAPALRRSETLSPLERSNAVVLLYRRALCVDPHYAPAWYNIGVLLSEQVDPMAAIGAYELALQQQPGYPEALNNMGVIYRNRGNLVQAESMYRGAVAARPTFAQAWSNLSVVCALTGKWNDAVASCRFALAADPNYTEAHNNLAVILRDEGEIVDALGEYEAALRIDLACANASHNRLMCMTSLRVSDPQTDRPLTVSHLGVTATSFWGSDAEAAARGSPARPLRVFEWIAREHKAWGRHLLAQLAAAGTPAKTWTITDPASARPLRIGIVSSDLMTHSVSYFIEALLRHANPRAVHNICFSTNPRPDARTAYLRSLSHAWVDLSASSGNASADAAARASIIEAHGVDVLVELNGHTAGNQLEALARAPAPVAVSWIGYPYSTGLPNIDYRLVDATTDPVPTPDADPIGFTDAHASERLVRLPGCFLCYTPPAQSEWSTPPPPPPATTPPVRGTVSLVDPSMGPGAAPYRVTFGSFNSMAKISPDVVACWAQILARVPDSRLVLKCKPLSSPDVIARLHAAFEAHGVARCRVKCLPLADSTRAHLASYEQVDIALDTFPYSGTTTTCEALLSNTPVVTFTAPPGVPCHSHNVSASLLRAVGTVTVPAHCGPDGGAQPGGAALDLASGFIAADLRGYITLAVQWAQPQWQSRLAALRAGMRAAVLASPLCDGPRFTRRVEHLWRQLYDWKVAQRSPAAFVPQW